MSLPDADLALAVRARAGDELAWRRLYDATRDRVFALLVYHCGRREEALDLLQETYLAAWRGLGTYRGEGSLESWLIGIALRRARDWKRRFLRWRRATVPLTAADDDGEAAPPATPPASRALQRALDQLPERQRSAFLLHEWLGYPFEEIGPLLGIAPATARVHAFRARQALGVALREPATPPLTGVHLQESES